MVTPAAAFSGEGSGTESDPFQITNVIQLQEMKNNLTAHYELSNNIDASDTVDWNNSAGFEPIGENFNNPFTGTFDGNGFIISNLVINRSSTDYVGLFGYVKGAGASISNVNLENANVTGKNHVGGLVGYNLFGSVTQSYSTGTVTGDSNVGGLVGYNTGSGSVNQSYSTGSVTGTSNVGGLVGKNAGSVNQSYSTGTVTGDSNVGGLVGNTGFDSSVTQSYSTGTVTGTSDFGGLVGYNFGSVTQSYWDIDTSGQTDSAGGTGRTTESMAYPYNSNTYVDWDFTNVWGIHGSINDGYPALLSLTNFPPNVSITEPVTNSNISGTFFVNASLSDPNGDSYISSVYLNNTTGNIANHADLPQDKDSVTFDSTSFADGIYNISWKAYENETEDGLLGFQTINITIDNTEPALFVNDDTTNAGNLSQDSVTCNISFSDENLNSSTIAIYNTSGLVNSNTSSTSPHSVTFEDLEEGTYQLNATVSDKAGNMAEMATREIVLDTTNPIINQIVAPSDVNTNDTVEIGFNVTDNIGVNHSLTEFNITGNSSATLNDMDNNWYNYTLDDPTDSLSEIVYNATFYDDAGNNVSVEKSINVSPIADFSANVKRGTTPLSVEFTDNSSGLVDTWNWDFGDGNTSTDQNPSHVFDTGNFTVNLTVNNSNGTSSKELNIRAAEEPAYTVSPNKMELLSTYGDEKNFSINSTLYSSYEWFIDGTPLNGSGVTLYNNNTDDSAQMSYCNVNTSQYIDQDDFFMDVYNISAHVSNESIGRTDVFSWEWTVTNSSAEDADEIDHLINKTPDVNTSGNESHVRFNTSNETSEKTGIECSIDFVSFNTSNETDGIQIKIEVLNASSLNESEINFTKDSVYQYMDISFNNETLVNNGSENRSIEFKVLDNVGEVSLLIDTVYLKHKGNSGWQSYEPELLRNDGTYSYFIVRDIPGFSPFAVTADYKYDSGSESDDGLPAYLKLQMLQNRSQSTEEDLDDEEVVTPESESDEDTVQENTKSDSAEQTTDNVPKSDEGDDSQNMFIGIGVLVLLAILLIFFRQREN